MSRINPLVFVVGKRMIYVFKKFQYLGWFNNFLVPMLSELRDFLQ